MGKELDYIFILNSLREIPFGMDGNFSIEALIKRFDSDLADDLGNLIYRTMTMVEKYFSSVRVVDESEPSVTDQFLYLPDMHFASLNAEARFFDRARIFLPFYSLTTFVACSPLGP